MKSISLRTTFKITVFTMLTGMLYVFSDIFVSMLYQNNMLYKCSTFLLTLFFAFFFVLELIAIKFTYSYLKRLFVKKYIDFVAGVVFGISLVHAFNPILNDLFNDILIDLIFTKLYFWSIVFSSKKVLMIIVSLFGLLIIIKSLSKNKRVEKIKSMFLSDNACEKIEEDEFNFKDKALDFSKMVYNNGSQESIVFGLDAPWGAGKSSFINFCKTYWEQDYKGKVIVYSFEPLKYENEENLMDKFIAGLAEEITRKSANSELGSIISKYWISLNNLDFTISFLGIKFSTKNRAHSVEKNFEKLKNELNSLNEKIIVVIDDLDRLNFKTIKQTLFTIKKVFMLPNISYILCYDTENIDSFEDDESKDFEIHNKNEKDNFDFVQKSRNSKSEKISEFLEKFVNVKISLFLDSKLLLEYFIHNKDKGLRENPNIDPELLAIAISGLRDIFQSNEFHKYYPFLGDARKIKRLINVILMLDLQNTDFRTSDIDKSDFINLLLIYVAYPNIFRKIYNTEMYGKSGFFSVVEKGDEGYPQNRKDNNSGHDYENSVYYSEYVETLSSNQKFLIEKVFSVEKKLKGRPDEMTNATFACFNNKFSGRNLENYLKLIIEKDKPNKTEQYRFYAEKAKEVINGKEINTILEEKEFKENYNEAVRRSLYNSIVNTPHMDWTPTIANNIINYFINSIPNYSRIKNDENLSDLASDIVFFIIVLLNKVGWVDQNGKFTNNTNEYIIGISERIFGDGKFSKISILDALCDKEKEILGIYDLLLFRLRCSSLRRLENFNLSRSLAMHGDKNAPASGRVLDIAKFELREISQWIFQIFKQRYLESEKNIFEQINNLSSEMAYGKLYIDSRGDNWASSQNFDLDFEKLKSRMKIFIIYQLTNKKIESSLECGYYDETDNEDKGGIHDSMNTYLFDVCFSTEKNFKHFIDFLLLNLKEDQAMRTFGETPLRLNFDSLFSFIDKELLVKYWEDNSLKIKEEKFENSDHIVYSTHFVASYSDYVPILFTALDKLVNNKTKSEENN